MPSSRLHILKLQKLLQANKPFLKSIAHSKTHPKRRSILKQAKNIQLRLLQQLLSAFIRQEIAVSKHFETRVKKSKKFKFLITHFTKIKSQQHLRENLLTVSSILPLFVKFILKKRKNE